MIPLQFLPAIFDTILRFMQISEIVQGCESGIIQIRIQHKVVVKKTFILQKLQGST